MQSERIAGKMKKKEKERIAVIFEKQVLNGYKAMAYSRCDDAGLARYFNHEDFPGLQRRPYPFRSSMGHTLQGQFYYYEGWIPDRLVIFDHGFFGGHLSYMKEIEQLCRHGFRVFAYDHTGCMASGGETPNGMAQSLHDLDDCIRTLKADPALSGLQLSVVGHSWGGFSTANIAAFHPGIRHVVTISGFVSVEMLVGSFFGGLLKPYRKAVLELERAANPGYFGCNAVQTLSQTDARVLLIYSEDDPLCRKDPHYDALYAALSGKPNVKLRLEKGKGHNPNYTCDAAGYLAEFSAAQRKAAKKCKTAEEKAAFVASFDWDRMTAQDEAVWAEIFACLDE